MAPRPLSESLLAKIQEQAERTAHLIGLIPEDGPGWAPAQPSAWRVEELLPHLLECLAGFCAVLVAIEPERLAHFAGLREIPTTGACSPGDTLRHIAVYRAHIEEGFGWLADAELGKLVPTVFVPEGETVLTLLLGNLEHLVNHKHALFTYLKQMGVDAGTGDLYCLRGPATGPAA